MQDNTSTLYPHYDALLNCYCVPIHTSYMQLALRAILAEISREFNNKLMDWLLRYNTKRFHWSLNLSSPVDYLLNNGLLSNMC